MTSAATITNAVHIWPGEQTRKVCLCVPSGARNQTLDIRILEGAMTRIFGIPPHLISVRYNPVLLLTVYTGEGAGHPNDEAALWGMRWTTSVWYRLVLAASY